MPVRTLRVGACLTTFDVVAKNLLLRRDISRTGLRFTFSCSLFAISFRVLASFWSTFATFWSAFSHLWLPQLQLSLVWLVQRRLASSVLLLSGLLSAGLGRKPRGDDHPGNWAKLDKHHPF